MGHRLARAGMGLMIAAGLALGGCQSTTGASGLFGGGDPITTGSVGGRETNGSVQQTTRLAQRWEADPSDADVALSYAASLEALGSREQAIQVLRQTLALNPRDARLLTTYGKTLSANGQLQPATEALYQAISLGGASWQTYSALGTVLDRMGEHSRAREYYNAALQTRPDEPALLNNLAMSHALGGAPQEAEAILRKALADGASGDAATTMRQNLALVLGLQGKFDEARSVLAQELPPDQVEANVAYIKAMLSQPNTWQQLQGMDRAQGASG